MQEQALYRDQENELESDSSSGFDNARGYDSSSSDDDPQPRRKARPAAPIKKPKGKGKAKAKRPSTAGPSRAPLRAIPHPAWSAQGSAARASTAKARLPASSKDAGSIVDNVLSLDSPGRRAVFVALLENLAPTVKVSAHSLWLNTVFILVPELVVMQLMHERRQHALPHV